MLIWYKIHIGSTTDLLCCRALEGVNCEAGPGSLPESNGIFVLPRLGGGSLLHKGPEKMIFYEKDRIVLIRLFA